MSFFLSRRAAAFVKTLHSGKPDAKADIRGGDAYPGIVGTAEFFQTKDGVLVSVEVMGLPGREDPCSGGIFAFHIHEGSSCAGTPAEPFAETGGHFNPGGCKHPWHAGDLPPLVEARGRAYMVVLTGRFTVSEIIGRTVVIHAGIDEVTSQPAGNAGKKIACGQIRQ